MKYLLSANNADVLAQLAWSRVLIALDFDGTLSPIVVARDDARMRRRTASLLEKVARSYPCAVISGRSRNDVASRLGNARVQYVIGNHGLEPGGSLDEYAVDVAHARKLLTEALDHVVGVDIEDKQYSLALHYRRSRQKQRAREAILRAIEPVASFMRVVPGKQVINVVPLRAANKGDALLSLRRTAGADTALYVGDDITDEDVFQLDQPGRLFTVRVGASRKSSAAYYLRDQSDIDRLLARLVSLRQEHPPHDEARP